MPETSLKVPAVPKGYEVFNIEGYDIYIAKAAMAGTDNIEFDLRGWFIFKEIVANGIRFPRI